MGNKGLYGSWIPDLAESHKIIERAVKERDLDTLLEMGYILDDQCSLPQPIDERKI